MTRCSTCAWTTRSATPSTLSRGIRRSGTSRTWQGCVNAVESNCYDGLIPRRAFVAGHTWTPRADMVNDFRFQYAYASYQLGPSGFPIFTDIGKYPRKGWRNCRPSTSSRGFRYGQATGELGHRDALASLKDDFQLHPRRPQFQVRIRLQPHSLRRRHRHQLSGHMELRHGPALQPQRSQHDRESEESDAVYRGDSGAVYVRARLSIRGLHPGRLARTIRI